LRNFCSPQHPDRRSIPSSAAGEIALMAQPADAAKAQRRFERALAAARPAGQRSGGRDGLRADPTAVEID
jgi:hypothetical protein